MKQFGVYLDYDRLMKCRGRINNAAISTTQKNPILLQAKHHFVDLLIKSCHEKVKHNGVNDTLIALRERYWIVRGRQAVKRVVRSCVVCKKFEGPPYLSPVSPDLPACRVSADPPFTHVGLDFAGPLYVKSKRSAREAVEDNMQNSKVYICLFTCASTRALHLELTEGLNAETFLLAFRRFSSRRGLPATLVSDNAKTFKSASKEIRGITRSQEVFRYLTNQRTNWQFIVAKAPWWGGFWERMVRSVKRCLRKIIGRSTLRTEELHTLLVEIESVINCRPLTFVYDDQEGVSFALTPSHLIYGCRITSAPNPTHFEIMSTHVTLNRRVQHHRRLLEQFTKCWQRDYLLSLREHSTNKQRSTGQRVKVGDVVLLYDEGSKRAFWKLALVNELLPGEDGHVRAAVIRVRS